MRVRNALIAGVSIMISAVCVGGALGVATASADQLVGPVNIWTWDGNVLNAQGCGDPAHLIEYAYAPSGCDAGQNEVWWGYYVTPGSGQDNYWAFYSQYGSSGSRYMCFNVQGYAYTSGTHILAYSCLNSFTGNERFYQTNAPKKPNSSAYWYYIHPLADGNLCLNVQGGNASGHDVILYPCNGGTNERFAIVPGEG